MQADVRIYRNSKGTGGITYGRRGEVNAGRRVQGCAKVNGCAKSQDLNKQPNGGQGVSDS